MELTRDLKNFILSLLVHFILFAVMLLKLPLVKESQIVGHSPIISSVVLLPEPKEKLRLEKSATDKSRVISKSNQTEALYNAGVITHQPFKRKTLQKPSFKQTQVLEKGVKHEPNQKLKGETFHQLVILLHDAIQRQQQYPQLAEMMGRKGRVSVTFTLNKEGGVELLSIAKSCGTQILDEAALKAVKDAEPFTQAKALLKAPQDFTIDVVFD